MGQNSIECTFKNIKIAKKGKYISFLLCFYTLTNERFIGDDIDLFL
jgi:hypothetical protein